MHDEKTVVQLKDVASRAVRAALMADGHVGYVMPIGGVAAYRNQASVVGVESRGRLRLCGPRVGRTDGRVDSRRDGGGADPQPPQLRLEGAHDGEELVVVRKGATPAYPSQKGFVGGSMGDDSVILESVAQGTAEQRAAMYSTVHGAGRVMSRTEARGKVRGWGRNARIVAPGKVSREMLTDWLTPLGVILRGGGLDEAPQAYRRLPDVLAAKDSTIRVLHTLTPIIVVMAGENEFDPYKD